MERQAGFTLIELMITITVFAILIGIGVPGFQAFINNNNRASTVNDFMASLHISRSEAVTRNTRVMVCSSTDGATCDAGTQWELGWIAFVDANNNGVLNDGEEIIDSHGEVDNFEIASTTFTSFITYRPNGRAMTADTAVNQGQFMMCDPRGAEFSRVVIIGPSGRPRSSESDSAGNEPTCA